ncbi:MAG: sodium:solute symporter family protein [Planctomycetota bacterium]|nr:sodium:solute symporter family protein [Planctomycetota bacterium]
MMLFGLAPLDLAVIVGYFVVVMGVGFWASTRVHTDEDYFLGGRKFGKGLLLMHWLCTGTHSDMAVQTAGACARVGLGGIWYQWMYLFSTPFYWLIGPMVRRLRVVTTGDVYRIRYGIGLEIFASTVAMLYLVLSIALLLRGAGELIAGVTGGALATQTSVIVLALLFSTYVMTGGLMAAAYTDFLQGLMLIVLSVLLVPVGLNALGGVTALAATDPAKLAITAPLGSREGDPFFVLAMSVLGLVGIVAQPHVMTANGSGKSEHESRVGMCYGNFVKRLLTIAWAFTGLVAILLFPQILAGLDPAGEAAKQASEKLYGLAIRELMGDGWRGLMIACIVAGVTSGEALMVVGAGVFTRNFYIHVARNSTDRQRLWVGRAASFGILLLGIALALGAHSVTALYVASVKVIALLGPVFWLGVTWRPANSWGAWSSIVAGAALWGATSIPSAWLEGLPLLQNVIGSYVSQPEPIRILIQLTAQFGALIGISLLTGMKPKAQLDPFFARLLTPVGREDEMALSAVPTQFAAEAGLGLASPGLDYQKASVLGYSTARRLGLEMPRMGLAEWGGFIVAWVTVGGLLGLLYGLSAYALRQR